MNVVAKAFLGAAIAIVLPTFAFYAVVTLVPKAQVEAQAYPESPVQPTPRSADSCTPLLGTSSVGTGILQKQTPEQTRCIAQVEVENSSAENEYQQALSKYNRALAIREADDKRINQQNAKVNIYRSMIATAIALVVLLLIPFIFSIAALVYGLGIGSGIILLTSIGFMATAEEDTHVLAASTLLVLFGILMTMLLVFERKLKDHPPLSHDVNGSFEQPATAIAAELATPHDDSVKPTGEAA